MVVSLIASPGYGLVTATNYRCAVISRDSRRSSGSLQRRPGVRRPGARSVLIALPVISAVFLTVVWTGVVGSGSSAPAGELRIASGSTSGVYNAFAVLLAEHLHESDHRLRVSVQTSTGSIQNLQRLAAGTADCAVTAADAATSAVHGSAPVFSRPVGLVAIARIYDDYVQLVARRGSGIASVADLRGKRVSLGAPGSGVELIADRVLSASGLPRASLHAAALGLNDSLAALRSGTIDAVFWSGGLPTAAIATQVRSGEAKLVPLGGSLAATLTAKYPAAYRSATIPTSRYGLGAPIATLAVPNFVVCRPSIDPAVTRLLTATIFAAQSEIARELPAVNVMDLRSAISTDPIPLDDGAARWYRSQKD